MVDIWGHALMGLHFGSNGRLTSCSLRLRPHRTSASKRALGCTPALAVGLPAAGHMARVATDFRGNSSNQYCPLGWLTL